MQMVNGTLRLFGGATGGGIEDAAGLVFSEPVHGFAAFLN